jgi:Tetratricopeptide repeat
MAHRLIILLMALLLAASLAGCGDEQPDGTPASWLEDAAMLEKQSDLFQEDREGAPLGAMEYYQAWLDHANREELPADRKRDIEHRLQWLSALKMMMTEGYGGATDYRGAIEAMTRFRETWPKSEHRALALFYRGLAREYDIDYQDTAGAIVDYRSFLKEFPEHTLVPEVRLRIAHCHEFNLDAPDYPMALEAYKHVIVAYESEVKRLGLSADNKGQVADLSKLMAVERALLNSARILDDRLAPKATGDEARQMWQTAADYYGRLMAKLPDGKTDRYFGGRRFKQQQFVHYRRGVLLAEKLGHVDEGLAVLKAMGERWRESPWYGKVKWKCEQIEKAARDR